MLNIIVKRLGTNFYVSQRSLIYSLRTHKIIFPLISLIKKNCKFVKSSNIIKIHSSCILNGLLCAFKNNEFIFQILFKFVLNLDTWAIKICCIKLTIPPLGTMISLSMNVKIFMKSDLFSFICSVIVTDAFNSISY